ncbi:putative MuDR-like transposon protein [Arabidopsis thaliana]|uniref:Putative MuDR-like transposon protein n=1 Tax=Arabidopsis thaliana TaxID=3702 RepID=O22273_ARATH|nr:putative MuDR-like transposon protein [Arabidopsis thaliana]CAB77991.1 putative MuDR-like transposon protein [Arabidopsis thaliana]
MADPVTVIVVSGSWVKKQRFVFNPDERGCRVVQLEAERATHDSLLKLVVDDYGLYQSTHQLRLSYMFSNKTLKNMSFDTPTVYISNDRQLQCYLGLTKFEQLRLCVEFTAEDSSDISRKDGSRGRGSKRPIESDSRAESTFKVPGGGFEGVCYDYQDDEVGDDESGDDEEWDDESGVDEASDKEAGDEEEDDEFSSRFDVFDDSDGASSDDEDFAVYGEPKNKDEDSPKLTPTKRTKTMEMIGSTGSLTDLKLELSTLTLAVGQQYRSKFELEYRLKLLAIRDGFDFDVPTSNKTTVYYECWVDRCRWRVRASRQGDNPNFYVYIYDTEHTCSVTERSDRSRQTTPFVLGVLYRDYLGDMSYSKSYKTLRFARELTLGTHDSSFEELPSYLYMIRRANPGTVARLQIDESRRFNYMFIAFGASIAGFHYMRRVVVVDGTFLHGSYKGTLLTALAHDDKSIGKAIGEVYPLAARGICTYHLYKNILLKFKGKDLFPLVKKAARCYRLNDFDNAFNKIEERDLLLHAYLQRAEAIRQMMTRWFAERRDDASKQHTQLTRGVEKLLQTHVTSSRLLDVQTIDASRVQVAYGASLHVVNVDEKNATCRLFEKEKLPCIHAILAAEHMGVSRISMCSPYYKSSHLVNAYAGAIMPSDTEVPVPQFVIDQPCLPLIVVNQPGRPKKLRMKSTLEVAVETKRPRKEHTCSRCKKVGHNVKT